MDCVCAEPLTDRSVYPCGHALCLQCTLKKRVLMKDFSCPYCRSPADTVLIVSENLEEVPPNTPIFQPGSLKVQSKELKQSLKHILNWSCPICDLENKSYKALKQHLQTHNKTVCDICTRNEFIFSDEYELIDPDQIKSHIKQRHIHCKYCNANYYSSQQFLEHCRKQHIGCIVCERHSPQTPLYFKNYGDLKQHYLKSHYMCMVPNCLANKHIVFQSELELRSHMFELHKGIISNAKHVPQLPVDKLSLNDTEKDDLETHKLEQQRYSARLLLAAKHDKDKVAKLEAANLTFLTKNVPVQILVKTYESVLENTNKDEITALLIAFRKLMSKKLTAKNAQSLDLVIYQRQADSSNLMKMPESKPNMKPQTVQRTQQKYSWGLEIPRSGGVGNVSALPSLGSGSKAKAASINAPMVSLRPRIQVNSLPTLRPPASKPSPSSSSSSSPSIALSALPQLRQQQPPPAQQLNRVKEKQAPLQLNSLPKLKTEKKNVEEKKRVRNVIRMV